MEAEQPAKVACEFFAQMDEEIELGHPASIEVTLSREEIQRAVGVAAVHGRSGDVDPSRNLIVMLAPKLNLRAIGETRHEIPPPPPGEPQTLYFDVEPVEEGAAEVWIVIRQGAWPLAQLMLHPRAVRQRAAVVRRASAPAKVIEGPTPSAPPHQLSIFERLAGGELTYQFIFDSPTLGLKNVYESKPIRQSREAYVNQLYQQLEARWVSSNEDAADFQAELRAFGAQLWDALLPGELQEDLWTHRNQIESVMVFSEEPFIPWELLHFKQPGKPLGAETLFLGQRGLVRWLHNHGWPPEVLRFREGRCRYAIPNYPHPKYALPQAQMEAGFLAQRFQAAPVTPQPKEVRDLLAAGGAFDLFHFAGHGDASHEGIANAQLLLEGRVENGNYLPAMLSATTVEQFAELRGADGSNRPVIVLNACRAGRQGYQLTSIGGFARAFLQRGAGMFVGALWSVGDQPARHFTETLYERLLAGDTLAAAVSAGREASRHAGDATWMAYAVYGHPLAKATR
jgi:hypothetical protein